MVALIVLGALMSAALGILLWITAMMLEG